MEHLVAPTPGRPNPRWSRLFTGGAAQTVSSPALIAGLPASSAMVCVGPPLRWMAPPPPAPMLLLPENVLLVTSAVPLGTRMAPPPPGAELPEKVLLVTVSVPPSLTMAPPPRALLPEKVLLVTLTGPGVAS